MSDPFRTESSNKPENKPIPLQKPSTPDKPVCTTGKRLTKSQIALLYTKTQRTVSTIFYISIVVACLVTLGGGVYTIADMVTPTGKLAQFQGLSIGYQIAIIGGFLSGLFILIVLFYGLFKRGNRFILKVIFRDRQLEEKYKNRLGIRIAAGGLLLSIFAIIIGIVVALFQDLLLGITTGSLLSWIYISNSQGLFILVIGIAMFVIIGLAFALNYIWHNGYYVIFKILTNLEETEDN